MNESHLTPKSRFILVPKTREAHNAFIGVDKLGSKIDVSFGQFAPILSLTFTYEIIIITVPTSLDYIWGLKKAVLRCLATVPGAW